MSFSMELYDPEKHDTHHVAKLIYQADEEFNAIVYGNKDEGITAINKMMQMEYNYFTHPHVYCALDKGKIVGVLAGFEGREKKAIDQASGKSFYKAFGLWTFLKRIPTYMRLDSLAWKMIDDDGYMINSLCVDPGNRGKGIGSKILNAIRKKYDKLYLEVNIKNDRAQKLYRRLGFQPEFTKTMFYRGKEVGLISMKYFHSVSKL